MDLANQSGAGFRADLNLALAALISNSSGTTEPTTTFAFQFWADTTNGLLKIRNAANNAWITIGTLAAANLGLLSLAGGVLTGFLSSSNTDYWKVPVGTTVQRPGTPAVGMIRYNSTLLGFEGYSNGVWAPIGGGGYVVNANATVASNGTISLSTTDTRQLQPVQGTTVTTDASITPFGTGANWKDGTEVLLVGLDDTASLRLTYNDAANGLVGDFDTIEITKYKTVSCVYNSALGRWLTRG